MTPQDKQALNNYISQALKTNDAAALKALAKVNDYALSKIIDTLVANNEILLHIKNITNNIK